MKRCNLFLIMQKEKLDLCVIWLMVDQESFVILPETWKDIIHVEGVYET
ncbi:hypothetical protein LTSEINV_0544 [Salmonella enterica subsp. enterica serovar Inverness str. R8-3668]|uniref:Uncharacterized protein n=1 Tax=Salmonella enterica subsp. enterica serovar Inverness str. R8-3668 TaxID=913075 RepID=G5N8A0_SALET|nr:hypothetical protein LTSEINV_0544 [Salmonella enterica subsp. enterica serovar Inverness str. R8-3668]